jgi:hypothetical protein
MPAAGFVRQGAGAVRGWPVLDLVTLRAAVVGGFPAGDLWRDRSATVITRRSSSPLRGAMKYSGVTVGLFHWFPDVVCLSHAQAGRSGITETRYRVDPRPFDQLWVALPCARGAL